MHKDFADWYRAANIEPDGAALPKRWAAVETFDVGRNEISEAARLFYGFAPRTPKFLQDFRVALQKADSTVKMSDNDQEIAVLAGAVLVDAFERCKGPLRYFAAFAAICPALKNLHDAPVVPAIPELATEALSTWSRNRFADQSSGTPSAEELLANKGSEDLKKLCGANDLPALGEPLGKIHSAVRKMQLRSQEMRRQLSLQSEETNMLWWLLGEHSRDTNEPFSIYSPATACLLAGKELADLTRQLPGPVAAVAFLDRIIRANRKKFPDLVTIESAVNDAPTGWKQTVLNHDAVDALSNLTPVISALKAASSVPQGESWSAIYTHATGVQAGAEIAPEDLADQVYLEWLLFRAWSLVGPDE